MYLLYIQIYNIYYYTNLQYNKIKYFTLFIFLEIFVKKKKLKIKT